MALLSSYRTESVITDTDKLLGANENSETSLFTVGSLRTYLQNNLTSPIVTSTNPPSFSINAVAHGSVIKGRAGLLYLDNNSTLKCAQVNNQIELVQDPTAQTTNPISELTIDFTDIEWDASSYGTTSKTTDNYFLYLWLTQFDSLVSTHQNNTSLTSTSIWIYDPRDPTIKAQIDTFNFSSSQFQRTDRTNVLGSTITFKNMSASFQASDKISFGFTTLPVGNNNSSREDFVSYFKKATASVISFGNSTNDNIEGVNFWTSRTSNVRYPLSRLFSTFNAPAALMFFNDGIEMAYSTTDPSSATTGIQVSATQKLFKNCINNDGSLFFDNGSSLASSLTQIGGGPVARSFGYFCRAIFLSTTRFVMIVNNPSSRLKLFTKSRDTLDLSTITTKTAFNNITSIGGFRSGWFNNANGMATDSAGENGVAFTAMYGRPAGFLFTTDTQISRAIFMLYGGLFSCLTTSYEKIFYKVEKNPYRNATGNLSPETICGFTSNSLSNRIAGRITEIIAWDNTASEWKHFKIKNTINRNNSQSTATSASYDDITSSSPAGGTYFASGLTTRFNHSYSPVLNFLIYDRPDTSSKVWTLTAHDSLMPESIDSATGTQTAHPPGRIFDIFRISDTRFGISFARPYFRPNNDPFSTGQTNRSNTPTALFPFYNFTSDDLHIKQNKQSIGMRSYQIEYFDQGAAYTTNLMILNVNNRNQVIPEVYESPEKDIYNFSNDYTNSNLSKSFSVKSVSDNSLSLYALSRYQSAVNGFNSYLQEVNTTVTNYRSTIFKKYTDFLSGSTTIGVINTSLNALLNIDGTRANIFQISGSRVNLNINLLTSDLNDKVAITSSGVVQYNSFAMMSRIPDITSPGNIKYLNSINLTYDTNTRITSGQETREYFRNYIYWNLSTTIPQYVPNSNPQQKIIASGPSSLFLQYTGGDW